MTPHVAARNPLQNSLARLYLAGRAHDSLGISSALRHLARALGGLITRSDNHLRAFDGPTLLFHSAQVANVSSIRRLSEDVLRNPQGRQSETVLRARAEVISACRSQVRKLRISRYEFGDLPGGEG